MPVKSAKEIVCRLIGLSLLASRLISLALIGAGCVTPVGVTRVDPRTAQHELTSNALTTDQPSALSAQQLLNLNLYQLFDTNPEEALTKLHAGLSPTGDEDRLFALAELSFLHAEKTDDRSYYMASAVYATAFLLPGPHGSAPQGIDPRLRWAADLYNRALAMGLKSESGDHVILRGGKYLLPFGELTIDFDQADLVWAGFRVKDFVSAAELEVRGLRNRYRVPGVIRSTQS